MCVCVQVSRYSLVIRHIFCEYNGSWLSLLKTHLPRLLSRATSLLHGRPREAFELQHIVSLTLPITHGMLGYLRGRSGPAYKFVSDDSRLDR